MQERRRVQEWEEKYILRSCATTDDNGSGMRCVALRRRQQHLHLQQQTATHNHTGLTHCSSFRFGKPGMQSELTAHNSARTKWHGTRRDSRFNQRLGLHNQEVKILHFYCPQRICCLPPHTETLLSGGASCERLGTRMRHFPNRCYSQPARTRKRSREELSSGRKWERVESEWGKARCRQIWGEYVGMSGLVQISLLWWYIKGGGSMYSALH